MIARRRRCLTGWRRGWREFSPEGVTVFQEEDARWQFQNGNAAFMRNWPYAYGLGQAEDSPIRDRFGVTRLPKGEGPEARHAGVVGGQQIGVSRYSRYKDAAADAARCLTDADGAAAAGAGGWYAAGDGGAVRR